MCKCSNVAIKKHFNKIVKDVKKGNSKTNFSKLAYSDKKKEKNPRKCEDQYIGILKINVDTSFNGEICWITPYDLLKNRKDSNEIQNEKQIPTIVVVLESPHKDEFFDGNSERDDPMPAMGDTGDNIIKYFSSVLMKYINQIGMSNGVISRRTSGIENGKYRIALVNVVQYQCSLGEPTKEFRNKVFCKMWNFPKVKKDFIHRLKIVNPTIIINCCTKFCNIIKDEIQKEINKNFSNCLLLEGYHPSSSLNFLKGFIKSN